MSKRGPGSFEPSRIIFLCIVLGLMAIGCTPSADIGQTGPAGEPLTPTTTVASPTTGPSSAPSTTVPAASTTTIAPVDGVRIAPGQSIQDMVDSHPDGTVFLLETGVHENQKVVPKDGNVFVGEPGAIMDGGNQVDAAFSNGGSEVTIQGLIVQNYATPAQRGAIEAGGAGWKIIDNEIRDNAGAGLSLGGDGFVVDGNYIHHNQQIGIIGQGATGARVVNNEISNNNHEDRYEYDWESGGTKFLRTTDLYIANNNVHDNHGPGLWADHDNYDVLYENNTVTGNYGPGIFHEISYDAVIRNNTVTGNAFEFYVGGILVSSSPNVEVYGNNVSGNEGGIVGIQDDRGSDPRGEYTLDGLDIHDNNVSWTSGFHGVQVNSGPDVTDSNTITYTRNHYTAGGSRPFKWGSKNSALTWQQWQSLGHDSDGQMSQ